MVSQRLIKICGLTTAAGVAAAATAAVDMVGFVFCAGSSRYVSAAHAASLAAALPPTIKRVGLFVNSSDEEMASTLATVKLDYLQLHGQEIVPRCRAIKEKFGVGIIKALSVSLVTDLRPAAAFVGIADYLLFDAKPPRGAAVPGGHGVPFDWRLLQNYQSPLPWLLAGGLTPANVAEAIRLLGPPGVDVSSGVESQFTTLDGQLVTEKDPAKIASFAAAVRTVS